LRASRQRAEELGGVGGWWWWRVVKLRPAMKKSTKHTHRKARPRVFAKGQNCARETASAECDEAAASRHTRESLERASTREAGFPTSSEEDRALARCAEIAQTAAVGPAPSSASSFSAFDPRGDR